jgi:hypothetical protein
MWTSSSICCHWCRAPLGNASRVVYLNGNLPVCDLCLIKAQNDADRLVYVIEEKGPRLYHEYGIY